MEITNSLLVAMMFIMILSMGIGNLLTGASVLFANRAQVRFHWLPMIWMFLLLLYHFDLFWQTLMILENDNWTFGGFLYVVIGPTLLYLAVGIILFSPDESKTTDSMAHYHDVARFFFLLLALVMIWEVCIDFLFGDGATISTMWSGATLVLFLLLAFSKNRQAHAILTSLALLLTGAFYVWRAFV